jgi:hypothetical protein
MLFSRCLILIILLLLMKGWMGENSALFPFVIGYDSFKEE